MRPIVILLIVLALGAGGVTVFLLTRFMASQQAQQPTAQQTPVGTSDVLVAGRDLVPGTVLQADDTRWVRWPNESIDAERMIVRQPQVEGGQPGPDQQAEFTDHIARRSIMAGEPMNREMVIKQGDRSVTAANIAPGMRAITLTVTPSSGVAGLILPGDHVDIVMNAAVRDLAQLDGWKDVIVRYTSETIMKDIRVVAINQKLSHDPKEGVAEPGNLATLEVTPQQAERLMVAQQLGPLTLTLRSLVPGLQDKDKQQTYTMDVRASRALSSLVALGLGEDEADMPADIGSAVAMAKERAKNKSEVKVNRGGSVAIQKFGGQ